MCRSDEPPTTNRSLPLIITRLDVLWTVDQGAARVLLLLLITLMLVEFMCKINRGGLELVQCNYVDRFQLPIFELMTSIVPLV